MSASVCRWSAVALGAIALVSVTSFDRTTAAPGGSRVSGSGSRQTSQFGAEDDNKQRLREGTLITDVVGYFRQDGDGATFVTDEGQDFGGLANLNLERVARTLKGADDSQRVRWSVSGEVTEFMGRNFLLISRAVHKSAAQPAAPEQISN